MKRVWIVTAAILVSGGLEMTSGSFSRSVAVEKDPEVISSPEVTSQISIPKEWKWRLDSAGTIVEAVEPQNNDVRFVTMAPGFHITSGSASLLYHPGYQARGNFAVEAEVFLFPGDSTEEYGVFLGGSSLEPGDVPAYVAFVARRDGKVAVIRRGAVSPVVDWTANDAVLPQSGTGATKNILRVDVNPREIVFSANGKDALKVPRAGLAIDGQFGFRVGKNLNIHASRLDVTHRLAPIPVK